ncbi:hypothetical protein CARUB_v10015281mg [Capsella rubella]|uniref:Uncharacterized protein n=1 Tax=Capsella rubella TaxID=81985 RepID=R0G8U2_9BRAS|nr:uncharacterized protein LOC17891292 [Capsella rubella]EOA32037.1 hypothetical protein CARUB_v10015281mg [Capsella rubella]
MALMVLRRNCLRLLDSTSVLRPASHCFSTRFSNSETGKKDSVGENAVGLTGCGIETVDDEAWHVSSSLSQAWRQFQADTAKHSPLTLQVGKETMLNDEEDPDLDHDEIDNMRIRGDLFFKLDRGSKEFEEYNYDFHRKNQHKNARKEQNQEEGTKMKKNNKKEVREEYKKRDEPMINFFTGEMVHPNAAEKKRERTFTFNQLTAPFHYPFCLDIYISKASVRACVIHRVTSKVVTVAHSISKDMKFDLGSTRNAEACAAVGAVLAQRSLEDDIHDVVYTPRKGDKIEGKLQVVLQALIDNGVNVKVKLKQRKLKKKTNHLTMA